MKNANYYHTNNTRINDNSRYNITQYHMGMPDLNTANTSIQQYTLALLEECIDCGVDGFRFDAAKHIELPNDPSNCKSNFWPTVINGAKDYASNEGLPEPFFYGEILGSPGPNCSISSYTNYMAVTDNQTGDRALDKAYWSAASELADGTYMKGASADKSVLWVESHDTYMGNSGSACFSNTREITSEELNLAWAIVGARADSTGLFFARPNTTMGAASSDTNWKSKTVAEINKFKNHFDGTSEYLASSGSTAYIERGTKGVVISKLDGIAGSVILTAHQMASGSYTDQITGNTFTVSNGKITGDVGATGVAVVYNANEDTLSYITEPTLYLKPGSSWTQGNERYAIYVFNSATGAKTWADMTFVGSGYYSATVPAGNWTNVIFCRMDGSTTSNSWENKLDQTGDLFPGTGKNCYSVTDESWSLYDNTPTAATEATSATEATASTEASDDTNTIYVIDNAGWNTGTMKVYYWGNEPQWPGIAMTSVSGTKIYRYDVPKNISGMVFNIGSNEKQTVDITAGIKDGAVFTISSKKDSSGKYCVDVFYLVGTMNGWSNRADYALSYESYSNNILTFKLSGVSLAAGSELKIHSTASADGALLS